MRTLVLVRHGDKAWKNNRKPATIEGYQYDPPLLVDYELPAATIAACQAFSFDHAFCSPFLRTRQTAQLLLNELNSDTALTHRTELAEYLGNHRGAIHRGGTSLVDPATSAYFSSRRELQLLMVESIARCERRVAAFLAALPTEGTFLVVSHGIILRMICGQEIAEGAVYIHSTE